MGHTRLGSIPKSREWNALVAQFEGDSTEQPSIHEQGDISKIAQMTLEAAQGGLKRAIEDNQLSEVFLLLTQVVLASRSENWLSELENFNISLTDNFSIFDLVGEMQFLLDNRFRERNQTNDLSEVSQKALGETLFLLFSSETADLFNDSSNELRTFLRRYTSKEGFGTITQTYFGKFLARYLNFYLSRFTARATGSKLLSDSGEVSEFNAMLDQHCIQSAKIVRDFGGSWVMKNVYHGVMDLSSMKKFIAVVLNKLSDELKQQGA